MFLRCLQRSRAVAAMMLCSFLVAGDLWCNAQTDAPLPNKFQLRALFLYNFAKFTTWPETAFANPQDDFVLGIFGEDPFGANINEIAGKKVQGRTLVVRRLDNLQGIKRCHMLFICDSEKNSMPGILQELGDASVLTVAEWEGFIDEQRGGGGMINLKVEKQKLGFEINQVVAEGAHLKFDSRLLGLASRVITRSGERTRS